MATQTLRLELKTGGWVRGLDRLLQRYPSAVVRSLNRSIDSANVVMVRAVAADMGLRQTDVRRYIVVKHASQSFTKPDQMQASITASSARIPLINFNARGPEPSRGRGRGVTARLAGGAGRYPNAFITTLASGHRGVFVRTGPSTRFSRGAWSANLPIVELKGPSVPKVFEKYVRDGIARGEEQMTKNLVHEMRFALRESAG